MVGRALALRLRDEGASVRAYVRRDNLALRAAGVHIAIGAIDDVPRLESALTQVHTIVHLVGGLFPARAESYDTLNRDSTEAAVLAAHAADVRRFLFLSFPGADAASSNEFLAAKGKAEGHVVRGGLEYAIFRCTPIVEGLEQTFAHLSRARTVHVPGDGTQRTNPVRLDTVVSALVAVDARAGAVRGCWDLGGPEAFTLDALAERFAPGKRRMHMGLASPAPKAAVEVLSRDVIVDPAAAVERFGLRVTPAE